MKYDGWALKNLRWKNPHVIFDSFHIYRDEVIEQFECAYGKGQWEKHRKRGDFKIVKVKLVEIDK